MTPEPNNSRPDRQRTHNARRPKYHLSSTDTARSAVSDLMPSGSATTLFIVILAITAVTLQGETPSALARYAAWGAGLALASLLSLEIRTKWRRGFRADLLMLSGLYFLTLLEFLADQPRLNGLVTLSSTKTAILLCFLGYAGLACGRHYAAPTSPTLDRLIRTRSSPAQLVSIYCGLLLVGFLYMLTCVSFNPFALFDGLVAPRFTQPWGRGKLGDWKALLYETNMLLYLVPPIAGVILGRWRKYSLAQLVTVASGLVIVLLYGFSTGTRNVFFVYVFSCVCGYLFATDQRKYLNSLVIIVVACGVLIVATTVMLEARTNGLKAYFTPGRQSESTGSKDSQFYVDYNLWAIATAVEVFPKKEPFMGLELVYNTLIRPIPRALWHGKPEGVSVDLAEWAGAIGMTMAASFVGEAYMSGGVFGVLIAGLAFGVLGRWWAEQGRAVHTEWGMVIYASGLYAVGICMRAFMMLTTAILPTIAVLALVAFLGRNGNAHTIANGKPCKIRR